MESKECGFPMNFLSRFWHKFVGQKSAVIRALDEVATRLEHSHAGTIAHLNNAFHPASDEEAEVNRVQVAADLRAASRIVSTETLQR